jgi:hypothetical protein
MPMLRHACRQRLAPQEIYDAVTLRKCLFICM